MSAPSMLFGDVVDRRTAGQVARQDPGEVGPRGRGLHREAVLFSNAQIGRADGCQGSAQPGGRLHGA